MNNFVKSIFLTIAKKFGLDLQEKSDEETDFYDVNNISITATMSDRVTTLTLMDSSCDIKGDSARAKYLQKFSEYVWHTRLKPGCVVSLGTGDVLLKPSTDGKRFSVDLISNNNFAITESMGNFIYGCIIKCDEIKQGNTLYERVEYHRLREINGITVCYIYQMAYKNGKEVPIVTVDAWKDYQPEIVIPNVDRLLFGRIKCPTLNRDNPNGVNGVPITYGLDSVVEQAKISYYRFNKEYSDKETLIFADKTVLAKDENGNIVIPKGKTNLFVKLRGGNVDNQKIDTYSPDIRTESLTSAIEQNFKMLEILCGLSNGVLSNPTTNFATATEIRSSLNQTFAYMTNFRKAIQEGYDDLMYAVNVLCNANNVTPIGNYEIIYSWSDKLMENSQETFNQLLQAKAEGELEDGELRAWVMNEDSDIAKEKVAEIKASQPTMVETVI